MLKLQILNASMVIWLLNAFVMSLMFLTLKNLSCFRGNAPFILRELHSSQFAQICSVNVLLRWILPFIVTVVINLMKLVNTVAISSNIFYVADVSLISYITVLLYHNTKFIYFKIPGFITFLLCGSSLQRCTSIIICC